MSAPSADIIELASSVRTEQERPPAPVPPAYTELITTSNFSFLRAGSHPEELVSAAIHYGMEGLGLCDRNSFAGVVRGYVAARDLDAPGFRYLVGVRLCFADGTPDIVAYPTDRVAYGRLCKLLTLGNRKGEKGAPRIMLGDLFGTGAPLRDGSEGPTEDFSQGQLFILVPDEADWGLTERTLSFLGAAAPGRAWVAGSVRHDGADRARLIRIDRLARHYGTPMLASNDVLYHDPARRIVQDVVSCIREHITLAEAGRRLERNAERHLKPPQVMARLFAEHIEALAETQAFAARIDFSLDKLRHNYPTETIGNGETAQETLERLTRAGAHKRYPKGIPKMVAEGLETELALIAHKKFAAYFLTVHDVVRFAREERKILCQGRGSAANSMVCYCLGITEVNPVTGNLVFGRFLSTERDEPPDIDVDFEHERREEVMQYVYAKYGGQRTGLTANVITYRSKSALRETAKVFGLSDDIVAALNGLHWGWGSSLDNRDAAGIGLNPDDPVLTQMLDVVGVLKSFPRHLSQHVGGFVITRDSLESLVPISKSAMDSRTIIEWNKDDIDALSILKVDILALGMLSCLRRAFELLHVHYDREVTLADLMAEERDEVLKAPVYAMTHRADTIGVFQIESRAQMSMLPRLRPVEFYDLVIEVAIVRPGPIQGGMVHPYLQRRQEGGKNVEYIKPELEEVLSRTYGVPLFQEQAMQIAVVGAGFSPGEADQLRRAMATWRRNGRIDLLKGRFLKGMAENGYPEDFAERCFKQIEGFGEYGFPESHAASFALLVYASCWIKCHYPDVFCCALLNSQPMGFYAPAQLIRDATEHGVEVRAVDVNLSELESVLEPGTPAASRLWPRHAEMAPHIRSVKAVRLGLSQVKGLSAADANRLIARRGATGYGSVRDLWLRTGLKPAVLEKLAAADAFASLGLDRRAALWAVRGLKGTDGAETLPLFAASGHPPARTEAPDEALPALTPGEEMVQDYRTLSFSLRPHPLSFLRERLDRRRIVTAETLVGLPNGRMVEVAGLVLVRQRPGTASGVIFVSLEDETGLANVVVWPRVFKEHRHVVLGSRVMAVRGQLQREGLVTHVVARSFTDLTPWLTALADGRDFGDAVLSRADEGRSGPPDDKEGGRGRRESLAERQARLAMPRGRNFH